MGAEGPVPAGLEGIVTAAELDGVRAPLPQATSLPPRLLTDPRVFDLECARVFATSWVPVAHVSDLESAGDRVATSFGREPVVVVRQADGSLRAFANVCAHRGMTIVDGGPSHGPALQCPYHLWTYRLDGSLAAAPDMQAAEGFDVSSTCLPSYRVEEWHGFVFVTLADELVCPPLATITEGLDEHVGPWALSRMRRVASLSYPSPWNWKVGMENFLESYHHAGTHPETLNTMFPGRRSKVRTLEPTGWSVLEHESTVDDIEGFIIVTVFPTFALAYNPPSSCVWFDFRPVAFDQTQLDIHILTDPALDADGAEGALLVELVAQVNDEDIVVNTRTWEGLQSRAARPGPVSHLEGACWQFRRWVVERLSQG